MATGDDLLILVPAAGTPTATSSGTFDTRSGASTPNEVFPCIDFAGGSVEYYDWHGLVMPSAYGGGTGVTIDIEWGATTGNTSAVVWEAAFRGIPDDTEDADTGHTYAYNAASAASAPSVNGERSTDGIDFTDGADMDSVAAGTKFSLRVRRNTGAAGDTMASSDAELFSIVIKER